MSTNKRLTAEALDAAKVQLRGIILRNIRDLMVSFRPSIEIALAEGDLEYIRKKIRVIRNLIDGDIPPTESDFIEAWWEHMVEDDLEVFVGR